jgi:hypothetical protein
MTRADEPAGKLIYKQLAVPEPDSGKMEKQYNQKETGLYFSGKQPPYFSRWLPKALYVSGLPVAGKPIRR